MIPNKPFALFDGVPFTMFTGAGGAELFLVHTLEEWKVFFDRMMKEQLVFCDTETEGFYWFLGKRICGLSFGWRNTHFYVPIRHKKSLTAGEPPGQLSIDDIRDDLIKFFSDTARTTVWHNAKFDMHFYLRDGISVNTKIHDTRVLWHFCDENAPGKLKVIASGWKDDMGRQHPGLVDTSANDKEHEIDRWRSKEARARREAFRKAVMAMADQLETRMEYQHFKRNDLKKHVATSILHNHEYADNSKDSVDYSYVPIELMTEYAALDTFLTMKLYEHSMKNIQWTNALSALYNNEMKLTRALFDAEETGVKIDALHLKNAGIEFDKQMADLLKSIQQVVGEDINLNSTQQLADTLLAQGVNLTKLTASGKVALDKKILAKLQGQYGVISDILKLRELSKLKGTYVEGVLEKIGSDNILHCSFNQNVSTGRMSSQDPNLQNIPAKDKIIRRAFIVPDDEYYYILADYSQIEVRLTAHFSKDSLLLDAYAKNQDIHTRTFCEMFGYKIEEVEAIRADKSHPKYNEIELLRTVAKRINFGIIYGVGAPGLSEQIERPDQYKDLDEQEWIRVCQQFIDMYMDKYIGVKRFVLRGNREVAKNHQMINHFGRVRHLPHANACKILKDDSKYWLEKRAQRQGVNFLVQSTAADLFKIAVVRIHNLLKGTKSKLVSFIHDEVQIYLHKDEVYLLPQIKDAMENFKFEVPIIADFSYSTTSWASKKSLHILEDGTVKF